MYVVYIMQEMTHIIECIELWPLEMGTFSTVALIFDGSVLVLNCWASANFEENSTGSTGMTQS